MTERVQQTRRKAPLPQRTPEQMDVSVALEPLAVQRQALTKHGARPQTAQRHAAGPVLQAARLDRQEHTRLEQERAHVQRQVAALGEVTAVQRQADPRSVPDRPTTPAEWVTVMRARAEEVQGQPLDSRSSAAFTTLQRQVAQTLAQGFRTDRGDTQARYAAYGEHLATLQRHPISAPVARVVLGLIPPAERLPLQRAVDETLQRFQAQEQSALNFDTLQALQRRLAELDAEATQPVLQRIQARRGSGVPLPEAIQRHLEQGLNHDLSRVRIHDDAEADKLAKGVNAIAFTTGTDIFFQSGRFNPNTQSGLELLAHEVTHTVQQSQGRVGTGIDPDAGLETEAQAMGSRLAQLKPVTGPLRRAPAMSRISAGLAVQRQYQTPLVFSNSQTKTALSLGGTGQAWEDAGAATQMAVQMVPARLKQQFKDMPATLAAGLQIMVRDIALTLGVSTAVGAAIGAFFGGVGAAPGAALGFEVGQLILGAWGLAVLLPVLKSQMDSLGWSVRQFTRLSKAAAGNPQKIKQAAEALTTGIVIFCNGLLLAIGALLLKQGTAWITKSRLGTVISATSEKSASLVWLKQRQQFGATRPVAKALVDRGRALGIAKLQKEAGLLSQGLKMASSAVKGIDPPNDPVRYQEAVKVGTLKYHLHPQFDAVKTELAQYGFQIRTSDHTHVVYRRLIDPKDKKQVTGVEKVLNLGPDVRFLDVLHELDHIRQLMVNLKGEVFTDTGVARQGGFKSFGNDALYRSTTLSNPQNVVTETHVRLKEYQRLRLAGADDAILAEHYEGVAHWLRQFREQTSSAKGSASNAALQDWAYTAFPDLQDLIDEFQTLVSTGVDTMRLR